MLRSLTSLRFFAALMVVFSHLPGVPFYEGYTGVTFFFVLSGFILSHRYAAGFQTGAGSHSAFWIARIARIYPLHILTLLLALPATALSSSILGFSGKLAAQLSLTQAAVPNSAVYFSFNYPSWSLSVEVFFYALFPVLVVMPTLRLALLTACVVAAHLGMATFGQNTHFWAYVFPVARVGDFICGLLVYRWFAGHPQVSAKLASAAQLASLGGLFVCYAIADSVSQTLRYDVFYLPLMAAVVLAFAWQNGALARAISCSALVFLGEASFALYLIHQLVIRGGSALGHVGAYTSFAYVLASVAGSALLFLYFEKPAKRATAAALRRWFTRRFVKLHSAVGALD